MCSFTCNANENFISSYLYVYIYIYIYIYTYSNYRYSSSWVSLYVKVPHGAITKCVDHVALFNTQINVLINGLHCI